MFTVYGKYSWKISLLAMLALASCNPSLQTEEASLDPRTEPSRWAATSVPSHADPAELAETGQRVYAERCVICHGKKGAGSGAASDFLMTKPRDFSNGEYKLRSTMYFPTDEDLFRTVTVGIPAYGMPSFEYLSAPERWAVVFHVKKLGEQGYAADLADDILKDEIGSSFDDLTAELKREHQNLWDETQVKSAVFAAENLQSEEVLIIPPRKIQNEASLVRGKELYDSLGCATCHGINGDGNGTSEDAMKDNFGRIIRPRNFREGAWYFKAGNKPADIVRVILGGVPGTPMPSYDLGEEENAQLWDVAHYVNQLSSEKELD